MIVGCVLGVKDNIDIFDISKYTELWLVAFLFEPAGAAAGFGIATMLGMDNASRVRSERQRDPPSPLPPPHTHTHECVRLAAVSLCAHSLSDQ